MKAEYAGACLQDGVGGVGWTWHDGKAGEG